MPPKKQPPRHPPGAQQNLAPEQPDVAGFENAPENAFGGWSSHNSRAALDRDMMASLARRHARNALAEIGLDDAAARDDLADLRAALANGRRLRFGLLQQLVGWCVQGLMLLVALGVIVLAGGLD
jgi:hypothetical protein